VYLLAAAVLLISTLVSFDRCLGRASGRSPVPARRPTPKPRPEPVGILD
jgi:hypothetical protein